MNGWLGNKTFERIMKMQTLTYIVLILFVAMFGLAGCTTLQQPEESAGAEAVPTLIVATTTDEIQPTAVPDTVSEQLIAVEPVENTKINLNDMTEEQLLNTMLVVALASLFGTYEHLVNNFGFESEIRPNATAGQVFFDALAGANPLLAPGILFLAALLAYAATYAHPLLASPSANK
jgi:hypothetical protein